MCVDDVLISISRGMSQPWGHNGGPTCASTRGSCVRRRKSWGTTSTGHQKGCIYDIVSFMYDSLWIRIPNFVPQAMNGSKPSYQDFIGVYLTCREGFRILLFCIFHHIFSKLGHGSMLKTFFRNTEKREFIEVLVGNPKYITCGETYKTQRQNTSKHHDSPHYSIMNCHLGWQNTSQFSQGMFVRANLRYSARNTEFRAGYLWVLSWIIG